MISSDVEIVVSIDKAEVIDNRQLRPPFLLYRVIVKARHEVNELG